MNECKIQVWRTNPIVRRKTKLDPSILKIQMNHNILKKPWILIDQNLSSKSNFRKKTKSKIQSYEWNRLKFVPIDGHEMLVRYRTKKLKGPEEIQDLSSLAWISNGQICG